MTTVPYITEAEARLDWEMAEFELDRAVFLDGVNDLDYEMQRQEAERLRARWLAVRSQEPDRRPFVGRSR
jgi:hypothetical protein